MSERRHESGGVYASHWWKTTREQWVCSVHGNRAAETGRIAVLASTAEGLDCLLPNTTLSADEARVLSIVIVEAAHIIEAGEVPQ